ncbi:MAG: DUF1156 domain-containing protein [Deltaproteobacteria bacterium]|jgi:putative DNA methylase|nr:DUF1156 domain-containing protein [Deltaproteobacteria bacterium]
MNARKKLIEVALPLNAINAVTQKELNSYYGRPATLHLWWSRKPLTVARAVLFASLIDDPSSRPDLFPTKESQDAERERLFALLTSALPWKNLNDEKNMAEVRAEIHKSAQGEIPDFFDPFAGGGSIPLEAQRLGLTAYAYDLNPVAVTINKAILEIPPKFAGQSPVNPQILASLLGQPWPKATGLAEDVAYYAKILQDLAFDKIGHLYPKAALETPYGRTIAPVVAWLWARTVKCPNPACAKMAPLVNSFVLAKKKGRELHYRPKISQGQLSFEIVSGPSPLKGTVNSHGAKCLFCQSPISFNHIREAGRNNGLASQLVAIVVRDQNKNVYLPPDQAQERLSLILEPSEAPDADFPEKALSFRLYRYGFYKYKNIFTNRQLSLLTTLVSLVNDVKVRVELDALNSGLGKDALGLSQGGLGAKAYAEAVAVYLSLMVDKIALYHSSLCLWHSSREIIGNTFGKRSLNMIWNYAEANPFTDSSGGFAVAARWLTSALKNLPATILGTVKLKDAKESADLNNVLISTDPPYYDNIGYADLSDFFYVWLRPPLKEIYKDVFWPILTPKDDELIATPFRGRRSLKEAKAFFETGMLKALKNLFHSLDDRYPLTIYYAFKQSESLKGEGSSALVATGWEAMLTAIIEAGFVIVGSWPFLTEKNNRPLSLGVNAMSSSVVLVCRKRSSQATGTTRRDFLDCLKAELKPAILNLSEANISPVDLAQAAIGPGMAVYSRYAKILEPDGNPLSVRRALALINAELDQLLSELNESIDRDSALCLSLFSLVAFETMPFSQVDKLARAKNSSVANLEALRLIKAQRGQVRLLKPEELPLDLDPSESNVWRITHLLVRALDQKGVLACAQIAQTIGIGANFAKAKSLAYHLYVLCERRGWNSLAFAYNSLVYAWPEILTQYVSAKVMSN